MSKVEICIGDLTAGQLHWKVVEWAEDRNIVPKQSLVNPLNNSTYSSNKDLQEFRIAQFTKLQEEVDELKQAIEDDNLDEMIDAVGDIMVCLSIQAESFDFTLTECFVEAYNQIKDRKGKMVDGVFVKEAE